MLSRILIVAALAVPMFAQYPYGRNRDDDYYGRNDDYRGGPYRDDRNNGYYSGAVIGRTHARLAVCGIAQPNQRA